MVDKFKIVSTILLVNKRRLKSVLGLFVLVIMWAGMELMRNKIRKIEVAIERL
jgi:hypothetical protein